MAMFCNKNRSSQYTTTVLGLCAFTHTYLIFSVFPYAGYFALFLLGDTNNAKNNGLSVDTIGLYVGVFSSAFTLGRTLAFFPWKKIRSRWGMKASLIASSLLSAIFSITLGMSTTVSDCHTSYIIFVCFLFVLYAQ